MSEAWTNALAMAPSLFSAHVELSFAALLLGALVSFPLSLLARSRPAARASLLLATSIVQTIPGLALVALFYPLLLAVSGFTTRTFGFPTPALGFPPALAALSLYAMLPIVRNTIAGLDAVDPATRDAADGIGLTPRQRLVMVELPLAAPVRRPLERRRAALSDA